MQRVASLSFHLGMTTLILELQRAATTAKLILTCGTMCVDFIEFDFSSDPSVYPSTCIASLGYHVPLILQRMAWGGKLPIHIVKLKGKEQVKINAEAIVNVSNGV